MPPAIIAVAATVASIAVAHIGLSLILVALLQVAIALAATALTARSQAKSTNQGQELSLKLDPTLFRQVVLGQTATGGSLVWAFTYTDSAKKPNRYLVRIIALSDLPCNSLVTVLEGDSALTFSGDPTTGYVPCDQHRTKSGATAMWLRVFLGSDTAVADASLVSWSGGVWTSAHKGKNICYAVLKCDYDADAFPNGEPHLQFVLQGAKLYDDRYDGSKPSRTGPQRLATPPTWVYSGNTAVQIAQVLRGLYSGTTLLFGAQAQIRDLGDAMLLSAYNVCDQLVAKGDGTTTQKRYESGLMISADQSVGSVLLDLQAAMDGAVRDRGGAITILPGATRTPVFNLTDTSILWTEEKSWQPQASLAELRNHVVGVYVDEENGYSEKAFPTLKNATWETNDGGERFSEQYAFKAVTNWSRIQRITKRIHQASRYQGTAAFVLPLALGLQLEQGDWFTLTSARWGLTTKYFEAAKVDISGELKILVVGKEVHPNIDGWNPVGDEFARTDVIWNPPAYELTNPDLAVAAYQSIDVTTGIEELGATITLTNTPETFNLSQIDVQLAYQANLAVTWRAATLAPVNQNYIHTGLLPATAYAVRIRSSDGLRFAAWSSWVNVTTATATGKLAGVETAADVSSAIDGLKELVILADTAGTPISTLLPKQSGYKLWRKGVDVTALAAWTVSVITGTFTATVGAATGLASVDLSGGQISSGKFRLAAAYLGITRYFEVAVTKINAAASTGGGSTGGTSSTASCSGTLTSTTPVAVATPASIATGTAGTATLTADYGFSSSGTVAKHITTRWQQKIAGTWTDVGTAKDCDFPTYYDAEFGIVEDGSGVHIETISGLAASTSGFEFRLTAYTSGSNTTTARYVYGPVTVAGG